MQAPIYFDNSATTPLSENVKQKIREAMECYGNPSSLHQAGVQASNMLRTAREQILFALGVRDSASASLIFTSCGSEANNLALFGTTHAKERRTANKIVTTDSEHPSIENCLVALEKEGFEIVRIPTRGGQLDMEAVDKALNKQVFLVTMMMVNNETGARYPVEQVFRMAKQRNPEVITHCDAIQGFLKCKFTVQSLGADLISISGHKIHAPKGVGALYVDKKILTRRNLVPTLLGGGQENGLRSGTENTIGIAAFGEAAKCGRESLPSSLPALAELRRYAVEKLSALEVGIDYHRFSRTHTCIYDIVKAGCGKLIGKLRSKSIRITNRYMITVACLGQIRDNFNVCGNSYITHNAISGITVLTRGSCDNDISCESSFASNSC